MHALRGYARGSHVQTRHTTCVASLCPSQAAALFPAAAIRSDLGLALTAARFLGPEMLATATVANTLTVRAAGP